MKKMKKRLASLLAFCLLPCFALAEGAGEWTADVPQIPDTDVGNDIVFYEIFTPSFSDSDGDGVGDLQGVVNRLDYLNDGDPTSGRSLGIDGIWLTPVFLSPSYHKYDVKDYMTIDPAFGDMEDLSALIEGCHRRNIRLILDLPINHTGYDHAWFQAFAEAHRTGDTASPYYDFYVWARDGEQPKDRTFCALSGTDIVYEANFSPSMPELDFENPDVREAVLQIAEYYLALGVDGFRFDAAKYVYLNDGPSSVDFWNWYTGKIREIREDAYLVAEVWDNDAAVKPYDPYVNCFAFQGAQSEGWIAKAAKAGNVNRFTAAVAERLTAIREARPDGQLALFIANHDMDRAAGYLTESAGQIQMAANLYLLSPGSPFIYYGEEIGLKGSRGAANSDANRRLAMRWGDGDGVMDPAETTYDMQNQTKNTVYDQIRSEGSLYSYYKRLLLLRRAHPEIAHGSYGPLSLPDTKAGGFVCALEGRETLVLHNTSKKAVQISLSDLGLARFDAISASIGLGEARLADGTVTLDAQTTVLFTIEH